MNDSNVGIRVGNSRKGEELLAVTDLGCFKAYKVRYDEMNSHPRLQLIEQFETDAHRRVNSQVSDEPGRCTGSNPTVKGARTYGERHNMKLEMHRRIIKRMAERLSQLVRGREGCRSWYLAANKKINHEIVDALDADIKGRIKANRSEDLVKFNETALVNLFWH